MALDAIALLRLSASDLPQGAVLRALDDGVLVRTGASFASEPDALARALRRAAGDALDRHRDPRGVLMIPDVARPSGNTYATVVDEVGEGGTWISIDEEEDEADFDGRDLLSTMMNAISTPEMQSAIARARDVIGGAGGDPAAAQARMMELAQSMSGVVAPGEDAELESEMRAMVERHAGGAAPQGGLPGGLPVDLGALMSDPAFQRMVDDMRTQLLADPAKIAELQSMFGALGEEDDDEGHESGSGGEGGR